MPSITLKAHYDGEWIRLDEPNAIPVNSRLLVTVLASPGDEQEAKDWVELAHGGLERAYGEGEAEYTETMIRER